MTARQHHFIPQCYLRGFVKHREKPKLFVVDAKERRAFRTTPANVAVERDFHRIDTEGLPIDAFENALSRFEGELSQALERIIVARSIKDQNDRALLLNLIGLTAIKNPRLREMFRDAQEQTAKIMMDLLTETPERWALAVKRAEKDGFVELDSKVTHEEMKEFARTGQYKHKVHPREHLGLELSNFDKTLRYIFNRKWILFKAPLRATGFITSDHPMCLMWSDPAQRGKFYGPGIALPNTDIFFPISNGLAMIGAFETQEQEIEATEFQIAAINGAFITYAERQIYARDSDFVYCMQLGEKIRRGDTLLKDSQFSRPRERPSRREPRTTRRGTS